MFSLSMIEVALCPIQNSKCACCGSVANLAFYMLTEALDGHVLAPIRIQEVFGISPTKVKRKFFLCLWGKGREVTGVSAPPVPS